MSSVPKSRALRRIQYAALPYRQRQDGEVQIRLITSRETRRWVIPKGWPMKGVSPAKAAAREAYEEAGLLGSIATEPLGMYSYEKRLTLQSVPCDVMVFPLKVKRYMKKWPERAERFGFWFSIESAAAAVQEQELSQLILAFGTMMAERFALKRSRAPLAGDAADEGVAADEDDLPVVRSKHGVKLPPKGASEKAEKTVKAGAKKVGKPSPEGAVGAKAAPKASKRKVTVEVPSPIEPKSSMLKHGKRTERQGPEKTPKPKAAKARLPVTGSAVGVASGSMEAGDGKAGASKTKLEISKVPKARDTAAKVSAPKPKAAKAKPASRDGAADAGVGKSKDASKAKAQAKTKSAAKSVTKTKAATKTKSATKAKTKDTAKGKAKAQRAIPMEAASDWQVNEIARLPSGLRISPTRH